MSGLGLRFAASTSRAACAATRATRIQSRALHKRKDLPYPIEEGLGSFLPPHALKVIAEDYQQGLLDRLNDQVRGTALENKSIVQTIVDAARDPNKVLEFNYASEALNNSFFLSSLKPPPADASSHEGRLLASDPLFRRIHTDYGSLAHFQSTFSAAALGMFSSGWIWLVSDIQGQLGIVPTFGAGTLLVRSRRATETLEEWQRMVGEPIVSYSEDPVPLLHPHSSPSASSPSSSPPLPPQTGLPTSGVTHTPPPLDPHTPVRSISHYQRPRNVISHNEGAPLNHTAPDPKKVGNTLFPLLCVSVHEHAWVSAGYGVWGKEEYMKRFWSVVDWNTVKTLYVRFSRMRKSQ